MRVLGPPEDKITMTVELDAADQLEEPEKNRVTVEHGLQPVLATLEMLLYPPANSADQIEKLASQGKEQLSPATLPITHLVWGKSRVVPVKLTNFTETEEAFDTNLNPIVAKVELGMTVLTYNGVSGQEPGQRRLHSLPEGEGEPGQAVQHSRK